VGSDAPDLGRVAPRAFQRDREGIGGDEVSRALIAVLDLQEEQPAVVRLRDWAMAAARPRPGQTVVDIGAGTGAETRRLAVAVGPQGRAVGIEPHPQLRQEAQRRAARDGSAAEFAPGDATALPFADDSVDVVRSERVFQHLEDPQLAANEVARVLRPGGTAVLLDTDWGTMVAYPADPGVLRRYEEAFQDSVANPLAGRQLRSWLAQAGLEVDEDVGSAALVVTANQLRGPGFLRAGADFAVASGSLTREESDGLVSGLVTAADRGEAFAAVTMFAAVGHKPRGTG
jgi:ubiquinone/menaquinone biosynthesis C-methylase UbiE